MKSMKNKTTCSYKEKHKHPNEIDKCRICNEIKECKIFCGYPKGTTVDRICIICWDKLHN